MSKALFLPLTAALAAALSLTGPHAEAQTVTSPPSSSNSEDRVATARQQHGEAIRDKFRAAGVTYPAEIFLRWLKREAVLELWARNPGRRFRLVGSYPILASSGEPGPKRREGDRQVPEGFYEIDRFNPLSAFHLSLGLNYPNAADRVLSDREKPGSDIYIHGNHVSIGCAPLGDDGIEEVYLAALDAHAHGQAHIAVHIFPARMSGVDWEQFAATETTRQPELGPFWEQLRPAYDAFESRRLVPRVTVTADGSYVVPDP